MKKLSTYVALIALLLLVACSGRTLFLTNFPKTYFFDYFPVQEGDTLTYVCHSKNDTMQFKLTCTDKQYIKKEHCCGEYICSFIAGERIEKSDYKYPFKFQFVISHNMRERKSGSINIRFFIPGEYSYNEEEDYWDDVCCEYNDIISKSYSVTDDEFKKDKDAIFAQLTKEIELTTKSNCVTATVVNQEGVASFVDRKGNYYELVK